MNWMFSKKVLAALLADVSSVGKLALSVPGAVSRLRRRCARTAWLMRHPDIRRRQEAIKPEIYETQGEYFAAILETVEPELEADARELDQICDRFADQHGVRRGWQHRPNGDREFQK